MTALDPAPMAPGQRRSRRALLCLLVGLTLAGGFPGIAANTSSATTQDLRQQVEARLDAADAPDVQVAVEPDHTVILRGKVPNLRQRWQVVQAASRVAGVPEVRNEVEVTAPDRPHEEIERDIRDALAADPATERLHIGVSVINGVATLIGTVESQPQAHLAGWIAAGIRGVRDVQNTLVARLNERPDEQIRREVQSQFEDTARFGGEIRVQVRDGVVELMGEVASPLQRTWVQQEAWVPGVRHVDSSGVRISPAPGSAPALRPDRDDTAIRQAVLNAFVYDPRVQSVRPQVAVENGVVTLTGKVNNLKAKLAAEQLAQHTPGVTKVDNALTVEPRQTLPDARIAGQIDAHFDRAATLEAGRITVDVEEGRVTLHGEVASNLARWEAADLAARTPGVRDVDNQLTVTSQPTAHAYFSTGTAHAPWFSNARPDRPADDEALRSAVRRQLEEEAIVNADAIKVDALQGTVTLQGTVDGWLERTVAEDNAYEAGAREVRNLLITVAE